jgi:hypothetical protein
MTKADVRGGSIGRMRALPYDERSDYYYDIHPITEFYYWPIERPLAGDTEHNLVIHTLIPSLHIRHVASEVQRSGADPEHW